MFARAVRVATIRGIEVRLDPTLIVLALLLVWSFSGQFAADHGTPTAVAMAVAGMVLILASILAHELAHALEATHRDVDVESITLLLFGGVTQMHAHSARPRDEFAVAAVGPFVSLLCGAVFGLLSTGASALPGGIAEPVGDLAALLALLNVLLAVFNLIPGAPLDGGRVLRAALWWLSGDRSRGIRWAARCGQLLGSSLIAFGIYLVVRAPQTVVAALWWMVIGAFLLWAAGSEYRHSRLDDLYTGTTVRRLLPFVVPEPPAGVTSSSGSVPPGAVPSRSNGRSPATTDAPVLTTPHAVTLPRLHLDADLHDLVDAFEGSTDRIVLVDDGEVHSEVSERQVARAIGQLRRGRRPTGAADHQPRDGE